MIIIIIIIILSHVNPIAVPSVHNGRTMKCRPSFTKIKSRFLFFKKNFKNH